MPPGLFILVLLLFAIFGRKNHRLFAIPLYLCAALLFILTSKVGVFLLVNPLEKGYLLSAAEMDAGRAGRDEDADIIIILGGGSVGMGESAELTEDSAQRVLAGAKLALETGLPVITSGGSLSGVPGTSEGEIMAETLISLGVPPQRVTAETLSRTTGENAREVASICVEKGYDTVVLVTSGIHMKRAEAAFLFRGLRVIPRPAGYEGVYQAAGFLEYLPSGSSLESNLAAIHEYAGILWYRIKYREKREGDGAGDAAHTADDTLEG